MLRHGRYPRDGLEGHPAMAGSWPGMKSDLFLTGVISILAQLRMYSRT